LLDGVVREAAIQLLDQHVSTKELDAVTGVDREPRQAFARCVLPLPGQAAMFERM